MVKLKENYDVVVIGAGPAGSRCSEIMAKNGLDVVVFEKRAEIGAPKRCAEGLGVEAIKRLGFSGKENFVMQTINGAYVYPPDISLKKSIIYNETAGYILERKLFDKVLAYKAAKAGAKFFTNSEVLDVLKDENGKITGVVVCRDGEELEVKAKVVVSAEGIEAKVARKAGINTTNKITDVDSGFQYEMANLKLEDPHKLYFYLGNEVAPRGYIWIFPKGEHVANVGIGIGGNVEKPAKWYLDKWIEENEEIFGEASIIEENAGGIPVGGLLEDMVLDGFVVVGDAAHTVNPIHGGGMDEGTRAGEIAAEVILKAFKKGDFSHDFLAKYNELWWNERGKKLKKVEKLRMVVERLSDEDLNFLAREISEQDLIDFTNGRNYIKMIKILMKKPKLIKLAMLLK